MNRLVTSTLGWLLCVCLESLHALQTPRIPIVVTTRPTSYWTQSRDLALFANDLTLQEGRGTGAVFNGAIQGYFTVSMGWGCPGQGGEMEDEAAVEIRSRNECEGAMKGG